MNKAIEISTGAIVEAMQIKSNIGADVLDFGVGLISSVEIGGLSPEKMDIFKLEINDTQNKKYIDCQAGDYLIKKDRTIFALHEKEFKERFELIEEENNMQVNEKGYLDLEGALSIAGLEGQQIKYKDWDGYMSKSNIMYYIVFLIKEGKLDALDMIKPMWKVGNPTDKQESDIKETGTIEAELPKKDVYNPLPEKDIFDPVKNATATLKIHERTIKDTVLEKIIKEKAVKFQYDCITYLKYMIKELATGAINGYNDDTEHYEKYINSLNNIRKLENEDFIKIKEKDLKEMLGFSFKVDNYCFVQEIEGIAKRIKGKESRD
jgi:hypothetical protein